ncbi:MAG: DegV family protein [Chloroflexi bacterium]|nr:DegV family protein [Chloroflexota bacterium]
MSVSIVTDSTSDIPSEIARELSITVVPLKVHFGQEVYRDRVDISEEQFFEKLPQSPALPTTSQPSAGEFAEAYRFLAGQCDAIISIHVSAKLSGTYNSAVQAREIAATGARIEVVDSGTTSMALGLLAMTAARAAQAGASCDDILALLRRRMPKTHLFLFLDTLTYLAKGGRIGKVQAFLGSVLSFKPLIACRGGELIPVGRPRTRARAIESLYEYAHSLPGIDEMAVVYSSTRDEAEALATRLTDICPRERIHVCRVGPVLGVHVGPGALGVAIMERDAQ